MRIASNVTPSSQNHAMVCIEDLQARNMSKSTDGSTASIRIRVYYLHDAGTETRVLTGVASAMTKAGEVCSVDAYSWHRGKKLPAGNIMDNLKSWMPGFQRNCRLV